MADVLIASGMDTDKAFQASSNAGPIWVNELIGYWAFITTAEDLVLHKTSDGGATWGIVGTIYGAASFVLSFGLWYDRATPGAAAQLGTQIHCVWESSTTPGTTSDGFWYRSFDTATDAFITGALRIRQFVAQTDAKGRTARTIGIARTRGGNLCAGITSARSAAGGGTQFFFYRSVDGGVTWVQKADFIEDVGNSPNDFWLMLPGNYTDPNDIDVAYLDNSANEVSLKTYDDSGDSWSEASIDAVSNTFTGSESMTMAQASIRHSDGHMILTFLTKQNDSGAEIRLYDINGSGSITKKTDVETNFDCLGLALTVVQNTDPAHIYVIRGDASGGTGSVDVHYRKSVNGGGAWASAVKMNTTARAFHDQSADWSIGEAGGRIMAVFYEAIDDDAYTNFDLSVEHSPDEFDAAVDWDNNGNFTGSVDDITADIRMGQGFSIEFDRGADKELEEAATGTLSFAVNNEDGKYSPENTSSVLNPNVLPYRPIRLRRRHLGVDYTLFTGFIEKYVPHPAPDQKYVDIFCVDGMDQLQRRIIEAPRHGAVENLKIGAAIQVSGVNITFNNANPDTIVRASGSFVTDGFQVGMRVLAAGSVSNNGSFVIATVVALTLTLDANETLTAEGPSSGITLDGYGPVGIALDEGGWATGLANRALDDGVDTFDVWWAHKESALVALRKLGKSESSFLYVDGDGKFVYEDRHHRLGDGGGGATDHLTSQATFSNTMSDMGYEFSARSVRNVIHARGEKLTAQSQAYVWDTRDTPSLPASSGATLEVWADFPNPVSGIVVPVANTDWKANTAANGTGDDKTSSIAIVGVKYGQALKMTLTNNTSPVAKVFIIPGTSDPDHTLRIQAKEYESNPVFTSVENAASKTAFGERALDTDLPFKGNFNDILSFAQYQLARQKEPQPDFIRMTVLNGTDALWTQILTRQLSDRITVTEDGLSISSQDYFINKMRHQISQGGKRHQVTWSLARIEANNEVFWVLGKVGYSELGQTTIVVF